MENRSFDHFLGWLPGAEGKQAGLSYADNSGNTHPTHPLAPDYEGCGHPDPDHSYTGSRTAYANGQMNGFLKDTSNDVFSIGYYQAADQPFFSALVQNYLTCDSYFASILGPTFPNRMFLWAAQTDRLDDSISLSSLPTIFDRLAAANVTHRYYFNNVPYLAFWGLKYIGVTSLFAQFLAQAASGTLPAVSFIDPRYTVLDDGTGNDNHPHADIRNGENFLSTVVSAITNGPQRDKTLLVITFDEWGGFFEHVAPPRVVAANSVDKDQVNGQVLLGFRIPPIVVSPFTRNPGAVPQVSHTLFDHTSILKLIEWRWNLNPLTPRDTSPQIGNLAIALNFNSPNYNPPSLPPAPAVFAPPCFGGGIFSPNTSPAMLPAAPGNEWAKLAQAQTTRQWLTHPEFQTKAQQ
jgi:phospholipase C